jgi:glycosyltransferase involved in cell wall biosynthesis
MKLSIITINYNNAAGLKKTLDSVAMQTYTDFEYIIVDGASSDSSVKIIREYEKNLTSCLSPLASNLKWISEKDTGIYNAMNKGIQMSNGEYLLFLNSGDFLISSDVLEKVFSNDCYADILCTRCDVSDNGKVVWTSTPPEKVTFRILYTAGLAHQSTFIRRTLFEQLGYYDESFRYNADIEFWFRSIVNHGATTQRIGVITTDYNLDGISSKENQSAKYIEEMQRILQPYKAFTDDYDIFLRRENETQLFDWIKRHSCLHKSLIFLNKVEHKLKKIF